MQTNQGMLIFKPNKPGSTKYLTQIKHETLIKANKLGSTDI